MNAGFCQDCCYKETETRKTGNGISYTVAWCRVTYKTIKALNRCPENYSVDEYNKFMEKCSIYDAERYAAEK
mgnify:CR=1 FL=1